MAQLNIEELATQMLEAAMAVLVTHREKVVAYTRLEVRKMAQTLVTLEELLASNQVTVAEARILLEMQRNAARSVLATVEGLGILAAESAINAALKVGRTALADAIGILLA